MSRNNKKAVDPRRWPGVLSYESSSRRLRGRPDVCYYIRYPLPDGKKRLEKVGWKSEGYTPQVASEIRAERMRKGRHGEVVKTAREIAQEHQWRDRRIEEIAEAYFSSKGESLKGRTTDLNRYAKHIKPVLGKRTVSSLSPFDVSRVESQMKALAPATVANALELLRRVINHGTRAGLCPKLEFVIQLPRKDNEVTEYLTPEEMQRFLFVLSEWPSRDVVRMLLLALYTGMRRGEIFSLKEADIDFSQENIVIRAPKGGKTKSIPMSRPVRDLLRHQLAWRDEHAPLSQYAFPGRNGGRRVDCSAADRIKQKAGLPKRFRIFHGLRHHFAVTLANSGEFNLDLIGELLTHKSIAMTKRYGQFLPGTMRDASNRAAELVLNVEPCSESALYFECKVQKIS